MPPGVPEHHRRLGVCHRVGRQYKNKDVHEDMARVLQAARARCGCGPRFTGEHVRGRRAARRAPDHGQDGAEGRAKAERCPG